MTVHPVVALAATILLGGCGTAAVTADTNPDTTPATPPPPMSTVRTIPTPATATATAQPVVERTTTEPPDPCAIAEYSVNALPWEWLNLQPAHTAYRAVAQNCLHWPPEVIDRWEAFIVEDVIRWESGGCWNLQRKGVVRTYLGCQIAYPNGAASDAGLFQLLGTNYAPGTWLCETHGYCDAQSIVGSPFDSMMAGLLFVEYDGRRPWSYNDAAKAYHPLWVTVPRYWP